MIRQRWNQCFWKEKTHQFFLSSMKMREELYFEKVLPKLPESICLQLFRRLKTRKTDWGNKLRNYGPSSANFAAFLVSAFSMSFSINSKKKKNLKRRKNKFEKKIQTEHRIELSVALNVVLLQRVVTKWATMTGVNWFLNESIEIESNRRKLFLTFDASFTKSM